VKATLYLEIGPGLISLGVFAWRLFVAAEGFAAHGEINMKRVSFLLLFLFGCGPHMTLLVHPKTGERIVCRAGLNEYGMPVGQNQRQNCVEQHEFLGFVQAQNLTPEQRATLVPRPTPTVIEQEVTIREGKPK
jgi:hypothetical protein